MMKLKRMIALLLCLAMFLTLAACQSKNSDLTTLTTATYTGSPIKVALLKNATAMGLIGLHEGDRYQMTLVDDPAQIKSMLTSGTVDIAACPAAMATELEQDGTVRTLAVTDYSPVSVLTNGVSVAALEELNGQTVAVVGTDSTEETLLKTLLSEDVQVEFTNADSYASLLEQLGKGDVKIAVLPEPYVSAATAQDGVSAALSLTELWMASYNGKEPSQTCVVVRSAFEKENPEAVSAFVGDRRVSVESIFRDLSAAVEKINASKVVDVTVSEDLVNRCGIVFADAKAS